MKKKFFYFRVRLFLIKVSCDNNLEIINPFYIKNAKTFQQNTQFEQAAANLLKLITKIDEDKMLKPSFLAIITATEYAYKREDGVLVLPLGLLKD